MILKESEYDLRKKELLYSGDKSYIYRLDDGRIFKKAKSMLLDVCKRNNVDYEAKILDTRAKKVSEIVSPLSAVYLDEEISGFTMEEVSGPSMTNYDKNFTLDQVCDLWHYYELFSKLESIVDKANKVGIVMPDICTCENIIIQPDGNIRIIDYDGNQIGENDKSICFSNTLEHIREYVRVPKFMPKPQHFSTELDKTSLTILMFLTVFNVDLNTVGRIGPDGSLITLKYIFDYLNIHDEQFMNKVAANLSLTKKGEFLASDLYRIAREYFMLAYPLPSHVIEGGYQKRLFKI